MLMIGKLTEYARFRVKGGKAYNENITLAFYALA